MYYSEYEHLIEMPDEIADDIEFLTDINGTIEAEVYKRLTSHINDYNRHMKRFKDSQVEIQRLKAIINQSAREAKIKQETIKKEAFSEGKKSVLGGFEKGCTAWVVRSRFEQETCPKCHGDKTLTVKHEGSEMTVPCVVCKNNGSLTKWIYEAKQGVVEGFKYSIHGNGNPNIELDIKVEGKHSSNMFQTFFSTKELCEAHIKTMRK